MYEEFEGSSLKMRHDFCLLSLFSKNKSFDYTAINVHSRRDRNFVFAIINVYLYTHKVYMQHTARIVTRCTRNENCPDLITRTIFPLVKVASVYI